MTDFEEELEEVSEPKFLKKSHERIIIDLNSNEADAVMQLAQSKGINQTTLIKVHEMNQLNETSLSTLKNNIKKIRIHTVRHLRVRFLTKFNSDKKLKVFV